MTKYFCDFCQRQIWHVSSQMLEGKRGPSENDPCSMREVTWLYRIFRDKGEFGRHPNATICQACYTEAMKPINELLDKIERYTS